MHFIRTLLICLLPVVGLLVFFVSPSDVARLGAAVAHDVSDELTFVWIWERLGQNLLNFKVSDFFDGGILFPSTESLIFSESMPIVGLLYTGLYRLFQNRVLAYNIILGLFLCSNFWAMFLFCKLFLNRTGALFAGGIFSFAVLRMAHIGHAHVLAQFLFPCFGILAYKYVRRTRSFYLWMMALVLGFQFYLSLSMGMLLAVTTLPFYAWVLWQDRHSPKKWMELVATGIFCALITLPLSYPYFKVSKKYDFKRTLGDVIVYSANPNSFFTVPPEHRYAPLLVDKILGSRISERQEKNLFIGFSVMLLAWLGYRRLRRVRAGHIKTYRRLLLWTFWFVVLIAMGRNIGLYNLLYYIIPGFKGIRTPARFGFSYLFVMSILAGIAVSIYSHKFKDRHVLKGAFLGFFLLWFIVDNQMPIKFLEIPQTLDRGTEFLARLELKNPVLYLPFRADHLDHTVADKVDAIRMYQSLQHGHRIVNGYSGFYPPTFYEFKKLSDEFLRGENTLLMKSLRSSGVGYILLEKKILPWELPLRAKESLSNETQKIYEDEGAILFKVEAAFEMNG